MITGKIKLTFIHLSFLCLFAGQGSLYAKSNKAEFKPEWDSLSAYESPEWFKDAKFGIYAHWGPYSVSMAPANTDWYGRNMYISGHSNNKHHLKTYGELDKFGYKDLIPLFTAEKFDADEWADLYVESGARFAGPVGEHADGFAMWDSKVNPWNSVQMGPRRDIVAEMEKAIRKRGMKFVVSMHHHWLWGWYPTWDERTDCSDPRYESFYGPKYPSTARARKTPDGRDQNLYAYPLPTKKFQDDWLEKVKEVVSRYSPDLLWFDNRMQIISEEHRREMLAFCYNHAATHKQDMVLTYKRPDLQMGTATIDLERSRMPDIYPEPWLTDTSVSRSSWAYASDLELYSTNRIIDDLVDIVSKNGCLLLNVAPHPDGTIPEDQKQRLREIGKWLKLNGEAIYGTRPWLIYGEGKTKTKVGHLADLHFDGFSSSDIRFTTKGDQLYLIALGWPKDGVIKVDALSASKYNTKIKDIELIGHNKSLEWKIDELFLEITVPDEKPCDFAYVFKVIR